MSAARVGAPVRTRALATILAAILLAATGCGSDDEPEPKPRPVETADKPAKLPEGWTRHVNDDGGFELGLPRGWEASDRGTSTRIRSFDELVVVSIAPDRTDEALEYDLAEFAARTLAALEGYERELDPGEPRRYKHRYDGAEVRAEAKSAASGVKQEISVIVLRRPRLALFTVVVQANAGSEARAARELAERLIATLRSRPVS